MMFKMDNELSLDVNFIGKHLSNRKDVGSIEEEILQHYHNYQGYVAWSGGKDSTALVCLVSNVIPDIPIVWFDSGLEYPDNREYIHSIARSRFLNLHTIVAQPDALSILQQTGFWDHRAILNNDLPPLHDTLITNPSHIAHKKFGVGELSGLRAEESVGRRALLASNKGHYTRKDGSQVYSPLWSWSSGDILKYLLRNDIPLNPVYAKLAQAGAPERAQRVGLVVDGNNPENGRYTYLRLAYPELWVTLCKALPRLQEWR